MIEAVANSMRSGEDRPRVFRKGSGGACLIQALAARDLPYRCVPPEEITNPGFAKAKIAEFRVKGATYYYGGGCLHIADPRGNLVPSGWGIDGPTASIARKKDLVKTFLRKRGISVPEGTIFFDHARREAEAYFARLLQSKEEHGICIKPGRGMWGFQVHVGIRDEQSFRAAFAEVGQHYKRILVEETVPGSVYRFTCVGGRVIAMELSRPANVEGDGIHTIAQLVELKNAERAGHPTHSSTLTLEKPEREFLERAGLQVDDVPEPGRLVFLRKLSNIHQGGEAITVTEEVHRSYVEVIERTLSFLPDLLVCGVDIAIPDAAKPATANSYHILDLNCCPGFSTAHHPWRGQPKDVAGAILDYLEMTKRVGKPGSPKPFSKGSSGDCVVEALTARGIAHRYLAHEEVTNPLLAGKTILAFEIGGVPYYFDGGSLRVSDPRGARVPGPLIDRQAALFVKRKDLVKSFLRRNGVSVPRGAAFPRDAGDEADSYFTALIESAPGGVCVKPIRGKKGQQVHVGLSDLASFREAFADVGENHE